ncbi:MAG: hypothetical protein M3Z25_19655 [Actinomycetota bacterium]|nr:hypothetical protein [Actinomycetota bacterium]
MPEAAVDTLFRKMVARGSLDGPATHSDPLARAFYADAAVRASAFTPAVEEALARRGWMDPFHLLDLCYRAANLLNVSRVGWADFLPTMDLTRYADLLATRNVATFVPERYRALELFLRMLQRHSGPVCVADWGCSTNHGLVHVQSARSAPEGLHLDGLTVEEELEPLTLVDPVGVDVMDLSPSQWEEWSWACAYGSPARRVPPTPSSDPVRRVVLDVTRPMGPKAAELPRPDVVHCSMLSQQLSAVQRNTMLANAGMLLAPGGFVVELAFARANTLSRPWNTVTLIHPRTHDGRLGQPLRWIVWESSSCQSARAGVDTARFDALIETRRAA